MSRIVFVATETGEQAQYSHEQVDAMLQAGQLTPESLYWTEGMGDWRPLREFAGNGLKTFDPGNLELQKPGRSTALFSEYAGFWRRVAAYLVDLVVLFFLTFVAGFAVGLMMPGAVDDAALEMIGTLIGVVVVWLYFAGMESSSKQGTLGKMALGLRVTDLEGRRIGFGRATGRHFGKIISAVILLIGYLMVAFTEKKQGLHDMLAGCLVVKD